MKTEVTNKLSDRTLRSMYGNMTDPLYKDIQATRSLLRHVKAAVEKKLEGASVTEGQRAVLEVLLNAPDQTATSSPRRCN